ncbi:BRO-N domain-containing protein [Psychromonas hadalis]|uniref:BRO-N domain-containing protein n=1 Tax=Psychromonas hadalis TaxID=211669 RepID=UPI0003B49EDB|nr:BRO family protein [Psychromonas hadalis]
MTNQLSFHSKTLTPIIKDGQTWLTAKDLSLALGYATSDAVTKVFNRNQDEFTAGMTETPNLGVSSNLRLNTRIFSLRGCHLIAMFSRTKEAKAFRHWVLNILDKEIQQPTPEKLENECVSKHGFTRVLMTFKNGMLTESTPVPFTSGIVSFESPEILQEMIRDTMPGYALVNKEELIKAFGL